MYAPVNLDGQVGIGVDVFPDVYELVCLVVHLAGCIYAQIVVDSGIPFMLKHMISVLTSNTLRPNTAHTLMITTIECFND